MARPRRIAELIIGLLLVGTCVALVAAAFAGVVSLRVVEIGLIVAAVGLVIVFALSARDLWMRGRGAHTGSDRKAAGALDAPVPIDDSVVPAQMPPASPEAVRTAAKGRRQTGPGKTSPIEGLAPLAVANLDPETVVQAMYASAAETMQAASAHLWILDPPTGTLSLIATAGPLVPATLPAATRDEALGAALQTGTGVLRPITGTAMGADRPKGSALYRFAAPVSAGTARGVAAIDVEGTTPPDIKALQTILERAAGPLTGALGLHVARDETRLSRMVASASSELFRCTDEECLVETGLKRAMELSGAATGSIMLLDSESDRMKIVASIGLPDNIVQSTQVAMGEGIAGWVLAERKPLLVEDRPGATPRSKPRRGIHSALSIPIADAEGPLGVINMGSRDWPKGFTEDEADALAALSTQVAAGLRSLRAARHTDETYFATLQSLASALERRVPHMSGTSEKVAKLADELAGELCMPADDRRSLRVAALLHNLGMDFTSTARPAADRPLTTTERGLMRMHPVIGAEILREIPAMEQVAPIVYHHHERFDGTGYVEGLSGEEIPLASRILAAADAFVSMTSEQPYRQRMSVAAGIDEMQKNAGTQFDPRVVEALVKLVDSRPAAQQGQATLAVTPE